MHRAMFVGKADAVIVEINVRAELQPPFFVVQKQRNGPEGLPCGFLKIAPPADVFHAERAFRVVGLRSFRRRKHGFRIFFGFGEVYGDFDAAFFGRNFPAYIFVDVNLADIIVCHGKVEKIFGGGFDAAFRRYVVEIFDNGARHRRQNAHDFGFKQQFFLFGGKLFSDGVVGDFVQNGLNRPAGYGRFLRLGHFKLGKQKVSDVNPVVGI